MTRPGNDISSSTSTAMPSRGSRSVKTWTKLLTWKIINTKDIAEGDHEYNQDMSLPIGDLLKGVEKVQKAHAAEGKIYNPDIPEMKKKPASVRPNPVMQDNYYRDLQASRLARSITSGPIAKNGWLPGLKANRQEWMLEGAMDPQNIRARRDGKSSLPYDYQTGAQGFKYQLRPSQMSQSDSISLMQKARASFANHTNLFQLPAVPVNQVGAV